MGIPHSVLAGTCLLADLLFTSYCEIALKNQMAALLTSMMTYTGTSLL